MNNGVGRAFAALTLVVCLASAAGADPGLDVRTDAAGNVTINGVVFAAAHGLTADELVGILREADHSTTWILEVTPEVAKLISDVRATQSAQLGGAR